MTDKELKKYVKDRDESILSYSEQGYIVGYVGNAVYYARQYSDGTGKYCGVYQADK